MLQCLLLPCSIYTSIICVPESRDTTSLTFGAIDFHCCPKAHIETSHRAVLSEEEEGGGVGDIDGG